MKPLRIVLVMIEAPLPFGNAAARWFYVLLNELVERGHKVTALAACGKPQEITKAKDLFPSPKFDLQCFPFPERSGFKAKLETFWKPYSFMFGKDIRTALKEALNQDFDVLHLEQLWSAWLGLEKVDRALVNVHHLTWIDLEHIQPPTWRQRLDRKWMLDTERRLVKRFKYFRSCSPRLVPEMLSENPEAKITTVPVGIDSSLYDFIPRENRSEEPVISVIGSMGWYPSSSAAKRLLTRLWPEIKKQVPNARVQIVGWNAREVLSEYLDYPDVDIYENVPEIQPYFESTNVLVYAPGRGSGMKIKVLEALAFGIPVVTTSEGAEGLPAVDGEHLGMCEDDAGLIERTVRLLKNPELQERQRIAGRALLEQHCGPKPTVDAIEKIYTQILQENQK